MGHMAVWSYGCRGNNTITDYLKVKFGLELELGLGYHILSRVYRKQAADPSERLRMSGRAC